MFTNLFKTDRHHFRINVSFDYGGGWNRTTSCAGRELTRFDLRQESGEWPTRWRILCYPSLIHYASAARRNQSTRVLALIREGWAYCNVINQSQQYITTFSIKVSTIWMVRLLRLLKCKWVYLRPKYNETVSVFWEQSGEFITIRCYSIPTYPIYTTEHRSPSENLIKSNVEYKWAKPVAAGLLVLRLRRSFAAKPAVNWVMKRWF